MLQTYASVFLNRGVGFIARRIAPIFSDCQCKHKSILLFIFTKEDSKDPHFCDCRSILPKRKNIFVRKAKLVRRMGPERTTGLSADYQRLLVGPFSCCSSLSRSLLYFLFSSICTNQPKFLPCWCCSGWIYLYVYVCCGICPTTVHLFTIKRFCSATEFWGKSRSPLARNKAISNIFGPTFLYL